MMLETINNSYIYYDDNHLYYVKDYYNYILKLIKEYLNNNKLQNNINIIIGDFYYNFNNDNKTIKIDINYEHTLVKKEGRDLQNAPIGKVLIRNTENDFYRVRIQDYDKLNNSNIIIDYSIPNIINIKECEMYNSFYNKLVYIAPIIYDDIEIDYLSIKNIKKYNCLTTFINTEEPRRKLLLENIHNFNIDHININNCFDYYNLHDLYKNTKILINIHQTEHHHTFEELRVLPALISGVIVICEDSPLKENIPYSKYLIWTNYENILDTIINVQNNYEKIYNDIFLESNIKNDLNNIKVSNKNNILKNINNFF
jgi:hypothetical protein